jgi:hypothetical protein
VGLVECVSETDVGGHASLAAAAFVRENSGKQRVILLLFRPTIIREPRISAANEGGAR